MRIFSGILTERVQGYWTPPKRKKFYFYSAPYKKKLKIRHRKCFYRFASGIRTRSKIFFFFWYFIYLLHKIPMERISRVNRRTDCYGIYYVIAVEAASLKKKNRFNTPPRKNAVAEFRVSDSICNYFCLPPEIQSASFDHHPTEEKKKRCVRTIHIYIET